MIKRLLSILRGRRLRNRRPFRLTAAGWVFILYTIGVGAGAINTGNNLLYLIFGVFLGLIMASGALSDMSLWGLEAECLWPRHVVAARTAMLPVRVGNAKRWLPSICVTVEIQAELRGDQVLARAYIPYIAAGKSVTVHALVTPAERGWLQVRAVRFQTRYPFGLLRKQWTAVENPPFAGRPIRDQGLFVFPDPIPSGAADRPPATAGSNPVLSDGRRGEGDNFYGLREYREADSPRRIHWKSSAKRSASSPDPSRSWLVRETELDQKSEVLLAFDASSAAAMRSAERETLFRFGAGLIDAYSSEGHRVRLAVRTGDGVRFVGPAEGDENRASEFLSLWNPDQAGPDGTSGYLGEGVPLKSVRAIEVDEVFRRWRGRAA